MAKQLQGVEAEYVFFAAYMSKGSDHEDWDVNGMQCLDPPASDEHRLSAHGILGAMLSSYLAALAKTGAIKKVKRIILTTGVKQYGLHLGAIKNPMQDSDPESLVLIGPRTSTTICKTSSKPKQRRRAGIGLSHTPMMSWGLPKTTL